MNNKDDKILISKVVDKYNKYLKTKVPTHTNFLNERNLLLVTKYLNKSKIPYEIYPKEEFLEKKIICFGEYEDNICFYKATINNEIKHLNILGTLFSKGYKEEFIGDIIIEEGYFYITSLRETASLLKEDLSLVKNYPITLEKVEEIVLKEEHRELKTILVSSLRLDSVLSKIINDSRTNSVNYIKDKKVLVNYEEASTNDLLKTGDILSIRKHGKYKIGNIISTTKKGKLVLEIIKYM